MAFLWCVQQYVKKTSLSDATRIYVQTDYFLIQMMRPARSENKLPWQKVNMRIVLQSPNSKIILHNCVQPDTTRRNTRAWMIYFTTSTFLPGSCLYKPFCFLQNLLNEKTFSSDKLSKASYRLIWARFSRKDWLISSEQDLKRSKVVNRKQMNIILLFNESKNERK